MQNQSFFQLRASALSVVVASLIVGLSACTVGEDRKPKAPAVVESPPAVQPTPTVASADDIAAHLSAGDYAGAIAAIESSTTSDAEKLATTGRLTLDGLVDPQAKTKPTQSLAEGISRIERAAITGSGTAIADLVGVFSVGVNFRGQNAILPPVKELAACWQAVQESGKGADECVSLRAKLGVAK